MDSMVRLGVLGTLGDGVRGRRARDQRSANVECKGEWSERAAVCVRASEDGGSLWVWVWVVPLAGL